MATTASPATEAIDQRALDLHRRAIVTDTGIGALPYKPLRDGGISATLVSVAGESGTGTGVGAVMQMDVGCMGDLERADHGCTCVRRGSLRLYRIDSALPIPPGAFLPARRCVSVRS